MASPGMMNRRVVLVQPAVKQANDFGEMVEMGEPTRYPIWASWNERAGREAIVEDQEVGIFPVSVQFWWHKAFADLDETWTLESERGEAYDITAVSEVGGRNTQIEVNAVRRS